VIQSELSSSFRRVVEETAPSLYRLAARITGSLEEAQDVLQDSYMKAWDALEAGRFEGRAQLRTWLYRIVANGATDALRARRRQGRMAGEARQEQEAPGASAEARAALRELAQWLDDLPPDQRTAIVLKELEGMTGSEIAEVMGCTEGAVEQRLVRARATLRERSERG
jgi:RNA polymerase sigma-70 factor (ECF subfamily)